MKLKLINDFQTLERNRNQWDQVAGQFPFFQWSWLGNWFKHLGTELKLAVVVACDEHDQWLGIAPWCIDATNPLVIKLRFLGSGDACTDYMNLICSDEHYRDFSSLASDWLVENINQPETLGRIDVVELEGITPTNSNSQFFCDLLDAHGLNSHKTDLEGGWVVDLPETWAELNATFSKSMRRKTKKATSRVTDEATQVLSTRDVPFEELWNTFTELHQKRREMLEQPGCFADHRFESFLRAAAHDLIKESKAELLVILFEGTPLASMLLLNDEDTVYTYQNGMDIDRLNLEPGYQVCFAAISRSIEQGFKRVDFLRGDEAYKTRWNTTRIPLERKRYIPQTTLAKFKHGIWLTGRSIKHYVADSASKSKSH
jgi:hypothetical protein